MGAWLENTWAPRPEHRISKKEACPGLFTGVGVGTGPGAHRFWGPGGPVTIAIHNAIIDYGNTIITFSKKEVTVTCKKAKNTRFGAMTNSNPPDFISKFPEVFPTKKITELQLLRKVNHHISLI